MENGLEKKSKHGLDKNDFERKSPDPDQKIRKHLRKEMRKNVEGSFQGSF